MTKPGYVIIQWVLNVIVFAFTLSSIFPLVWMFYSSLKTNQEFSLSILSLPKTPTFTNFQSAFEIGRLGQSLYSSVFNTFISLPLIILLSFILGYFFARFTFRGKKLAVAALLLGMVIPIHSLLVPLFVQFNWLGLLDRRGTLLLPYIAFNLPLAAFLFQSFIRDIPGEIEEAAFIDGSSFDNTLFRVILPICLPMMATVAILNILNTWNELPFALILNKSSQYYTLPVWLTFFSGQFVTDYTGKIAGLVITSLPTVVLYLLFSRRIMEGMTAGAVKG